MYKTDLVVTCIVFLGMQRCLHKLSYYGIKGNALDLFSSYLENRLQYVAMYDIESGRMKITTSIPQGSILSPLLFITYLNDIISALTLFKFIIYADDTLLFSTLSLLEVQNYQDIINSELDKISVWLKLSLNIKLTKFILFYKTLK